MLDLQQRLARAGFAACSTSTGLFGPETERAIAAFQGCRGVQPSGRCDAATWTALVEAGFRIGDRVLYARSPMMRGDDVSDLQQRLGQLGFNAGRVDAIFGPDTHRAVMDFQRNAGLVSDGVCGAETMSVLLRLSSRHHDGGIAQIREFEHLLAQPKTLLERRIVVAQNGGLSSIAHALVRVLRRDGALVLPVDEADQSEQARLANTFDGELFLGLEAGDSTAVAFYRGPGFESPGGRQLATLLVEQLSAFVQVTGPAGVVQRVLRETRMPAVTCTLGPGRFVVNQSPRITEAIEHAITNWVRQPVA